MRESLYLLSMLAVAVSPAVAVGAEEAATQPVAQVDPDLPLATVGGKVITRGEVDGMIARVPHGRKSGMTAQLLDRLISRRLAEAYVKSNNLSVDEDRLAEKVRQLRTDMALEELFSQAATPEKIKAYIAAHPGFFDGTRVRASQILILSPISAATAEQLAAREKLRRIAKDIADGKITFAAAATKHSDDASKSKGGDCGAFGFDFPMEMPLKIAAFSLAKGKVSPVFRSGSGWHLVLVTDVKSGDGKPKPLKNPWTGRQTIPESLAKLAIREGIERKIMLSALGDSGRIIHHQKLDDAKIKTPDK